MRVWLVWENVAWQGDNLWGAYATQEIANSVVAGRDGWSTEEVEVRNTPVKDSTPSWHGN